MDKNTPWEPPPKSPARSDSPAWHWDIGHSALSVLAAGLAIAGLWLWSQYERDRKTARTTVAQAQSQNQRILDSERIASEEALQAAYREAARGQATAFAAAIQPLMSFRGQVPEITNRSVQAAAEDLARRGNFSLVAISDSSGSVISSTDLATVGRPFPGQLEPGVTEVEGQNQAIATIGESGSTMGFVVLRMRQK